MENPYEKRDQRFRKFKAKDPSLTFGRFMAERMHKNLAAGEIGNPDGAISVALGDNFWFSGEARAKVLLAALAPEPRHKIIDYGCGSLRIGAHFIRCQDPGCFLGLDVIAGFYEFGKQAIGADLLAEKAPRFHVIDEAGIAEGEAFGADIVYSNVVCVHVHPDETADYFRNLVRLVHKPGARLFFSARISPTPVRFEFDGWSWPMEFYRDALAELQLVKTVLGKPSVRNGFETQPIDFEFRRG